MAGQDNRLGAPTEGLGQNVTFAIGGSQRTPQTGAGQQGSMRMAMGGDGRANNTASGQRVPIIQDNGVMQTLMRFGEGIIKPKLDAARNEAFVTGMQRVATGEAIKEIVDEQPWYANVFGDTPTVEGARAYAGFAKSQEVVSAIEADMPNLRSQSPDAFKQLIAERLNTVNTGDLDTDLVVKQSLIKESASLMKRHTKEHIGWQQDNFAKAQQGAQIAAANGLAAVLGQFNKGSVEDLADGTPSGSTLDDGDKVEKQLAFISTFNPIPGVPEGTTQKLHAATIGGILSQGNLHAFYTLLDGGVVSEARLGADNFKRLMDQADRIESRKRAEMPSSLAGELAEVKSMVAFYDRKGVREETNKRIDKLNATWQALTGAREPLIAGKEQAEIQSNLIIKQENAKRTIRETYARQEAARSERQYGSAVAQQDEGKVINDTLILARQGANLKDVPAPAVRGMWNGLNRLFPPSASAEQRGLLYETRKAQAQHGEFDDNGRAFIVSNANRAIESSDVGLWHTMYVKEYLPLITKDGRHDVATAYFGDYGARMHAYHSLSIGNDDVNGQVAGFNVINRSAPPVKLGKDDSGFLKAVAAIAKNDNPTPGLFTSNRVSKEAEADLVALLKPMADRLPGVPTEDAVASSMHALRRQGIELVGGHLLRTNGGPSFSAAVNSYQNQERNNIPADRVNEAVSKSVELTTKKYGLRNVRPQYDVSAGVPRLLVMGYTEDGQLKAVPLTIPEIHEHWGGKPKAAKPEGSGQPSIYASPEEWAVYRKKQSSKSN